VGDKTIIIAYSNRAEQGIIEPVIRRLKKHFDVIRFDMGDCNMFELGNIYKSTYALFQETRPTAVMCPFDRCEMIFPTLAAYHLNIPVISLQSGDISSGTFDDIHRHAIALYSDIHLCVGPKSAERTRELLRLAGKEVEHVYDIGCFSLDDLKVDESLVPPNPYLLVLYNPPTRFPELIPQELEEIENMLHDPAIWVAPNNDIGSDSIIARVKKLEKMGNVKFLQNLPRQQFLGLLKNASKFISNSSCLFFEAPHFFNPEQIVHIGIRNRGREPVELKTGGSDRIVEVLKKELETA